MKQTTFSLKNSLGASLPAMGGLTVGYPLWTNYANIFADDETYAWNGQDATLATVAICVEIDSILEGESIPSDAFIKALKIYRDSYVYMYQAPLYGDVWASLLTCVKHNGAAAGSTGEESAITAFMDNFFYDDSWTYPGVFNNAQTWANITACKLVGDTGPWTLDMIVNAHWLVKGALPGMCIKGCVVGARPYLDYIKLQVIWGYEEEQDDIFFQTRI